MLINHNPYEIIFQLFFFYRAVDDIVLLMHFARTAFYFVKLIFPKHPLFKNIFEKLFLPSDRSTAHRTRRVSAEFYMLLIIVQRILSIHTSVIVRPTDDRSNSFNFLL